MKDYKNQLNKIRSHVPKTAAATPTSAHPNTWEEDGVDHINIHRDAATELGRTLDPSRRLHFQHPVLGHFDSPANMWYFLRARNPCDELRDTMISRINPVLHRQAGGWHPKVIANLEFMMAEGIWTAVQRHPTIQKLLKKSTLPFDTYYTIESGLRIRILRQEWLRPIYTEIRAALQEEREPNFSFLTSDEDPYQPVRELLGFRPLKPVAEPAPELKADRKPRKRPKKPVRPVVEDIDNIPSKVRLDQEVSEDDSNEIIPTDLSHETGAVETIFGEQSITVTFKPAVDAAPLGEEVADEPSSERGQTACSAPVDELAYVEAAEVEVDTPAPTQVEAEAEDGTLQV